MEHVRQKGISHTNSASAGLIFVGGTNTPEGRTNPFVPKSLFTRVIENTVIRQYQVCSRTDFYSLGRDRDSLCHEPIGFFKESLGIDHHAVSQHASLPVMNDPGWN